MTPEDHMRLAAAMDKRRRKLADYMAAHPMAPFAVRHNWQSGYRGQYTGDGTYIFPPPWDSVWLAAFVAAQP